jgi:hypothetical protein
MNAIRRHALLFPILAVSFGALTVSVTTGCSKKPPSEDTPSAPAVVSASAAVIEAGSPQAPPPQAAQAGRNGTSPPDQSIGGHLATEAASRTPGNPSVEAVFALCERLGAPVPSKEQSLARTYHASYCIGGFTTDRAITINVCEYPDEASVAAGVQVSQKTFPTLADRRHVYARRGTTLTLFESQPSPATTAMTKKLSDAFLAM